jgi:sigma-E factor negative regulatory protein RseC
MNSNGIVVELMGDRAKVKLQKHAACGDCGACQHGHENMEIVVEALNQANASEGDYVVLDLETANVLGAAFIVYVIPLIAFLISMFFTKTIMEMTGMMNKVELVSALMGFVAMGVTFLIIKKNETRFHRSKKYLSTITSIVDKKQC